MVLDVKSFHVRVCYKTVVMTTFGAINEESNKPVMLLRARAIESVVAASMECPLSVAMAPRAWHNDIEGDPTGA